MSKFSSFYFRMSLLCAKSYGHVDFVLHQKPTIHRKFLEMRFVRRGGTIFHGGDLSVVVQRGFRGSSPEVSFIFMRRDDSDGRTCCETLLELLYTRNINDLNQAVKQVLNSNQKTILLVIYNSQNQRRYIGVKLD